MVWCWCWLGGIASEVAFVTRKVKGNELKGSPTARAKISPLVASTYSQFPTKQVGQGQVDHLSTL